MAKEKSKTPNYDANTLSSGKKVHDLVGMLHDISDDDHMREMTGELTHMVETYRYDNKGSDHRVDWAEKGEQEHKRFAHSLWDKAADHIAKSKKWKQETIDDLKKSGDWDDIMATYMGGLTKDRFWNEVKSEGNLSIENMMKVYVNKLSGRHLNYRHTKLLEKHVKEPEDMDSIASYVKMAKGHHKKALRDVAAPKKFKSLDEAMNKISTVAQYIPENYHPDKADTYTK